ncbi:MAG: galactosyltransferase-related protein [Pseudomonadota bacterium]
MTGCDLSDVSVIISLKADSAERISNLYRLHRYYTALDPNADIIVVSQSQAPDLVDKPGLRIHAMPDDGLHWKTRNMNVGANLSVRRHLLMSDADVVPYPDAVSRACQMLENGTGFVSLYNGIVVNTPRAVSGDDWTTFFARLPHYERGDVIQEAPAKHRTHHPLYGNNDHMAVGGCFLCTREAFVTIGGWNPNFVSYGFEDQELFYRAGVLGRPFKWIMGRNLVHFDHPRGPESRYGAFYRQNSAEFDRVKAMSSQALSAYQARGFRQMPFNEGYDYARFSNADADGWHRVPDARCDLSGLTIMVLADPAKLRPEASCLERLLTHLEETYRAYDLRLCENRTSVFKYPSNRKNVVFCQSHDGPSPRELNNLLAETTGPHALVFKLEADADMQFRRIKALLAKVKHGLPVEDVFPSLEDALVDAV